MINNQMIMYAIDDAGLYKAERLIFCTIMFVVRRANYFESEGLFKTTRAVLIVDWWDCFCSSYFGCIPSIQTQQ